MILPNRPKLHVYLLPAAVLLREVLRPRTRTLTGANTGRVPNKKRQDRALSLDRNGAYSLVTLGCPFSLSRQHRGETTTIHPKALEALSHALRYSMTFNYNIDYSVPTEPVLGVQSTPHHPFHSACR